MTRLVILAALALAALAAWRRSRPEPRRRPTAADLRGLARGRTGGLSSEAWVRQGRDRWDEPEDGLLPLDPYLASFTYYGRHPA